MTGLHVAEDVYLPLDIITSSNGILAKKGARKTSAAVVLLEEMHQAGVPVIVVDPKVTGTACGRQQSAAHLAYPSRFSADVMATSPSTRLPASSSLISSSTASCPPSLT